MGGSNLLVELLKQSGIYKRSLVFFLGLLVIGFTGYQLYTHNVLKAAAPVLTANPSSLTDSLSLTLSPTGDLFVGNTKVQAEVFTTSNTYRYRYQIVDNPTQYIDTLQVTLALPQAASDSTVSHSIISNGGASTTSSSFINPTTIVFTATGITPASQLSIEFEVPKSFVTPSFWFGISQQLQAIPLYVWLYVSIGVLLFTIIILLLVGSARFRTVEPSREKFEDLPSRLAPAYLGILLRGQLTSRDLAATFIDLAVRGHIVIRQLSANEFRFRRLESRDRLEDFEEVLLTQIFGPTAQMASSEEINFMLSSEIFSKRVSQAFTLAYKKINQLGFFYTNPLSQHLRYQLISVLIFVIGLVGFLINLFLVPGIEFALLIWGAVVVASLLIYFFANHLPARTLYGDHELSRWLSFRRYLVDRQPIHYSALSHEEYLTYLPYAVVMNAESDWTRRFYELPFSQPSWYSANNIATIDQFANSIFPMFGYLSHSLSLSVAPAAR